MRILDIQIPARPTATSAVVFDPWPFDAISVLMHNVRIIREAGELDKLGGWSLSSDRWNVLVTLSDGTHAVATEASLAEYLKS